MSPEITKSFQCENEYQSYYFFKILNLLKLIKSKWWKETSTFRLGTVLKLAHFLGFISSATVFRL